MHSVQRRCRAIISVIVQSSLPDPEETELAPGFRVKDYKQALKNEDRDTIANAIVGRFLDRYIEPVKAKKHGFTIMAISCLMIEALQSFREGWQNTKGKSELAFCRFFSQNDRFNAFQKHSGPFYIRVRCGILHQAETTGGWRIKRIGPLFNPALLTINATHFLDQLEAVLNEFRNSLKTAEWHSEVWKRVRAKMNALCDHCRPQS
jgi:hypothetical protein